MSTKIPLIAALLIGFFQIGVAADIKDSTTVDAELDIAKTHIASADVVQKGVLEEVIVTATRQETALSKTAIALSAITGESLRDAGVTNPTTLGELVPSLSIDRTDGLQITIRGVTNADATEVGDPSAAFMLDGIYIARGRALDVSFFDLERIEVLRGPQGTLWGRNTTAGVVNVISAKPALEFQAYLDTAYGNFHTFQTNAMVNVPVSDTIALRAAINNDRRDNFIVTTSPRSIDPFKDNLSARVSALFNIGDNVELIIRGDIARIKGHPDSSVPATNFFTPPFVPDVDPTYFDSSPDAQRTSPFPIPSESFRDNDTWGLMGELNWDFGSSMSLAYLGSYREMMLNELVSDGTAGINEVTFRGDYWQLSQELRLAFGPSGPLSGQVGGYYFKEQSETTLFVLDPQNFGFPPFVTQFGFPSDPTIAESYAFFGQVTYELTDKLRLTGGARYSHDFKSRVGATVMDTTFPPPDDRVILDVNDASRNFSKTTWSTGVEYDAANLGLMYLTVSTGYKAGGFNDGCEIGTDPGCTLPANALYYEPETLTSYEGGFKFTFLENTLGLSGAVFHYDYYDLQLSNFSDICGVPCQVTTNAAQSKVDGVEIEAIIMLAERHRIVANANYLNARYEDFFPVPTVSFAGKSLDRAPRFTISAGYTYSYPMANGGALDANVRTRFSDEYVLKDLNIRVQLRQPSFHKTDVSLTYSAPDNSWFLQAFAKNLENEITLSAAIIFGGGRGQALIHDPRTFGVRVGVNF